MIRKVLALLMVILFGAFNANPEQLGSLQNQVEKMIEERLSPEAFEEVVESSGAENKLEENNEIVSRFSFQDLRDETALIKSLQFTRLIVDLSKEPNRYTVCLVIFWKMVRFHFVLHTMIQSLIMS